MSACDFARYVGQRRKTLAVEVEAILIDHDRVEFAVPLAQQAGPGFQPDLGFGKRRHPVGDNIEHALGLHRKTAEAFLL